MDAVKTIDEYIIPNYEVLHSESRKNVTQGLIDTLKRWEDGVANDRVIDTVELYTIGILDKASALGRLSEHQPNHQICILSQPISDKYLKFVEVIEL